MSKVKHTTEQRRVTGFVPFAELIRKWGIATLVDIIKPRGSDGRIGTDHKNLDATLALLSGNWQTERCFALATLERMQAIEPHDFALVYAVRSLIAFVHSQVSGDDEKIRAMRILGETAAQNGSNKKLRAEVIGLFYSVFNEEEGQLREVAFSTLLNVCEKQ